jgi:hypothetical protein
LIVNGLWDNASAFDYKGILSASDGVLQFFGGLKGTLVNVETNSRWNGVLFLRLTRGRQRRSEMIRTAFMFTAGLLSAAMLANPAPARAEATQEPGVMGFNYPSTPYLLGGYGHRFSPFPSYYYGPRGHKPYGYASSVGAVLVTPPWGDNDYNSAY